MSYQRFKQKNLAFFSRILKESNDGHGAVAQSKVSHLKRFRKMMELGEFDGKSLLDVGCGVGGFYGFLKERGVRADYTGIDICEDMIRAAKQDYPAAADRFLVHDMVEDTLDRQFDYVVSIGPLNLEFEEGLNLEITLELTRRMWDAANLGMAISMTSSLTKRPDRETYYYDPVQVLSGVFSFCTNVRWDHTFLPHDFALFCYKKDLYDE